MVTPRKRWVVWVGMAPLVISLVGCKDNEAPPSHYRDLGNESTVLAPTASVLMNASLKEGTATWHPFREPGQAVETVADETAAPGEGVEEEIVELLEEYNGIAGDGTNEDLLAFFVEEQQDAVGKWLTSQADIAVKTVALRDALLTKLPDEAENINGASALIEAASGRAIKTTSLKVISDAEVVGEMPAGSAAKTCRFVIIDDEWFIELPDLADQGTALESLNQTLTVVSGLIDTLDDADAATALKTFMELNSNDAGSEEDAEDSDTVEAGSDDS